MNTIAVKFSASPERVPLRVKFRRVESRRQLRAFTLLLPLLLFVLTAFAFPIGRMLENAVYDKILLTLMPQTMIAIESWDGTDVPDESAFAALAGDLKEAWAHNNAFQIGNRINYELPGAAGSVLSSARQVSVLTAGPYKQAIIAFAPLWGHHDVWSLLKRARSPYTAYYLLRSVDYQYDPDGKIVSAPAETAIFRDVFLRTFGISTAVTIATLLLGFPVAYLLATVPPKTSNLLMIMVVLPFWTSGLVRSIAWVVLLQKNGVINNVLLELHIISQPLELIFNRFSTVGAMINIQVPITLLPIYSVMKTISPNYVRAARSLGAGPFYAFWKVYFPQTLPGVVAGCLLTFILCLGYYITPSIVGGPADQMISYFIAHYTNEELNWGMASALGAILLTTTMLLYLVYNRLAGADRLMMR
ncbi:ABC transporter permease [Bradyrhizobium sp. WSM1253]|uniref:ABC transporter permease n=1 Tax=Bradyrhizobium sp. WSM1253 TaxID=319003 RepID=UPI00025D295C|nr:ABC transporter permease [Bradyrhizobium sp. WSM1253]EIG61336.1 ABC-type spermidine/putrescine transport system, permease component I [Bradyrhizobium sp. WSM1253]